MLLTNGRIYTLDEANPVVDTLVVRVGKLADLVVLSDDVFTCPESRIAHISPVLTLVGGQIVYRRAAA